MSYIKPPIKTSRFPRKLLAIALAFAMLALSACGGGSTSSEPEKVADAAKAPVVSSEKDTAKETEKESETAAAETKEAPAETERGTLTVGRAFFPATLDPAIDWNGWYVMQAGIGESLVFMSAEMQPTPWLAETIEPTETGWVFKIKEGVTFHNGKAMTPEIVKASIERGMALNERGAAALEGATVTVDGQNVIIETPTFDPHIPDKVADPLFMIVDTELAESDPEGFGNKSIGTGPYMVEAFTADDSLTVVPFDDYHLGRPNLESLSYTKIPDANARMLALQAGEIDLTSGLGAAQLEVIEGESGLTNDRVASNRVILTFMNPDNEILQDKKVREALNFGFDKQTLANETMRGAILPADGPYPPSLSFGEGDVERYHFDPAKASALLAEAGYEDSDGDGIVEKDGEPLKLRLTTYTTRVELPIVAQFMQSEYRKIGIDIEIVSLEQYPQEQYSAGDFDLGIDSYTVATSSDPASLFMVGYGKGASQNHYNYFSNERFSEIEELMKTEGDIPTRIELAMEAEQIIIDELRNVFVGYTTNTVSRKNSVENFYIHPLNFYEVNYLTSNNG